MKKIILSFVLVTASLLVNAQVNVGDFFPVKKIKDLQGNEISTADLLKNDGKPVIIDFWATWCKPCLLSIKYMHENYAQWQQETGVKIILITIDDNNLVPKVQHMKDEKQWKFDVYHEAKLGLKETLGWNSVPQTYLIDANGKIVYHASEGGQEEKLYKELKKVAK